jgi:phospholipid-binding lipoprotein MlaA
MRLLKLAGLRTIALLAMAVALTGCASLSEKDPYEKYNRSMFEFNDAVDRNALKPAATAYKAVTPSFVQTGISNFFGNLGDVWNSANNLLQGKGEAGMSDFTRVIINTTFGLAGLLDVASEAGLPKHNEDFGQTLGYWGMPSGPYVMLPLLGPSTLRDTAALPVDVMADPWGYGIDSATRNIGTVVRVVDQRAALLDASTLLEDAALDRYEFIRDGYLQQRKGRVFDGEGSRAEAVAARNESAEPSAKSIKAAYADEDEPSAKSIKAAYDDPEPAKADAEPAKKEPEPAVSSETGVK